MEVPGQREKSIRVAVRVRPLLATDGATETSLLQLDPSRPNEVVLASGNDRRAARRYTFDQVFGPDVPQDELYGRAGVADMVSAVVGGYHATIFAYGQTGSGKTYSMEGYHYVNQGRGYTPGPAATAAGAGGGGGGGAAATAAGAAGGRGGAARAKAPAAAGGGASVPQADFGSTPEEQLGLTPRAVRELFAAAGRCRDRRFTVKCSFVQIYREQVYDLLNPATLGGLPGTGGRRAAAGGAGGGGGASSAVGGPLKMRWSAQEEFFLENVFTPEVETAGEAIAAFQAGVANKVMSSHRLNAASSRSHCLFTLLVSSCPVASPLELTTARLTLVDLAGSERAAHTGATEGALRDESVAINKSLFTLRQVITALTETETSPAATSNGAGAAAAAAAPHVPYRDSKLTCLLKHSLGGNSLTLMLACLSPADRFLEENASTLDYAARARRITNQVVLNEDPRSRLIRELRQEVAFLRQQLEAAGLSNSGASTGTFLQLGGAGGRGTGWPAAATAPRSAAIAAGVGTAGGEAAGSRGAAGAGAADSDSSSEESEAAYARRLREAAASDVEVLVRSVIEASRVAVASSSALAGLRAAYARTSATLESLRTEYDILRVEDARLRDRVAMLEALVSDGGLGGAEGGGSFGSNRGHGGGVEGGEGGGGWYTASTAALIELEELRRENALLHERLQLFDPTIDPGGRNSGAGGGGSDTAGRGPRLSRQGGWATAAAAPPPYNSARPGTSGSNGGGFRGGGTAPAPGQSQRRQSQQQQHRALSAGALRPTTASGGAGGSSRAQMAAAAAAASNPFTPHDVLVAVMPPGSVPAPSTAGGSSGGGSGRLTATGGRPGMGAVGGGGGGGRTLTVDQLRNMLQMGGGGGGGTTAGEAVSNGPRGPDSRPPSGAGGGGTAASSSSTAGRLSELSHTVASRALASGVRLSTTGKLLPAAPARMAVEMAAAGGTMMPPSSPPVQLQRPPAGPYHGGGGGTEGADGGMPARADGMVAQASTPGGSMAGAASAAGQTEAALAQLLAERNALRRQRLADGV